MVEKEIDALLNNVGIMEVSGFNRYEITGDGAHEFLDQLVCSKIPAANGKVRLCYFLTEKGHVLGEATIAKLDDNHLWWGSAAAAEWHDLDWLNRHKPESVQIRELTSSHTILVVAGPKSRELLQSLSPRCDWSKAAFPWMSVQTMTLAHAKVLAMSVSFSGELAYELHIPNEQLYLIWQTINSKAEEFNLSRFGLYATESMRMEKGYRHWKADLIYEHNPMESCLDRFVDLDKPDFIGKSALEQELERGHTRLFVTLTIDCEIASAHAGDSIYVEGASGKPDNHIGTITSGGYGHRVKKNIAYAFVKPEYAEPGQALSVQILGETYAAVVTEPCLFDPSNERVRA